MKLSRVIISGGGTGGHIFPAISIANGLKARFPEVEILFVGAIGRMEMERVPAAGYQIEGLPVLGFNRASLWKNFNLIPRLIKSLVMAKKIVRRFKPDIAIGVGGYASGPTLWAAASLNIPTLIQEQNSYAGLTNKFLARKAARICVAYEGMERFFPKEKIVLTGNPVRKDLEEALEKREEALAFFGLSPEKKTILVIGGSLGARTLNQSIAGGLDLIAQAGVQLIWQTGPYYANEAKVRVERYGKSPMFWTDSFITRMNLAYAAADLVVSRAGAGTVSELCLQGKPVILVPSPNVAEDHQTKNALALVNKGAAVLVADSEAEQRLVKEALKLVGDDEALASLSRNIVGMALHKSVDIIINEIIDMLEKSVYFVGAGGIGMSALIRYYLSKGKKLAGYDRAESALTAQLIAEGAEIHYSDDVELIPAACRRPESTLVVYTPAVPDSHSELTWFRSNGFEIMKRSQVLGKITGSSRGLCVAGTHGKTTTSSMIAHLLKQSKVGCNAFLGGILKNYGSNLLLDKHSDLTVIEADEYDRSFHWLSPYMAVITSADPDHLDIYGTAAAYRESFEHFTSLVRPGGCLLMRKGVPVSPRLQSGVKLYTYSANEGGDYHAANVRTGDGKIVFDCVTPTGTLSDIRLGVPVKINIENAVAAIAIATLNGASFDEAKEGVASFRGPERRFDFHLNEKNIALIDDYAHHPSELRESILSIRELYAGRKITGVFQPHLYSRTRDFADDFASALSLLDELLLLHIYPAREEPIPGITSQIIFDKVTSPNKTLCSKAELLDIMSAGKYEVVLMLGAGDIDRLVEPVKKLLSP